MKILRFGWLMCVLVVSACSSHAPTVKHNDQADVVACLTLFEQVDQVVIEQGVANAGEATIAGYPFLRTNRLLASYRPTTFTTDQLRYWVTLMANLDQAARLSEVRNLPDKAKQPFVSGDAKVLVEQLDHCRDVLTAHVMQQPRVLANTLSTVVVPEDYVAWQRVVGLYYVSGLPIVMGVKKLRKEIRAAYAIPEAQLPIKGQLFHVVPPEPKPPLTEPQLAAMIQSAKQNPLNIPMPNATDRALLFDYYAPEWLLDVAEANDQMGQVFFAKGETLARVDVSQPTVYRRISHTRFGEQTLLQLNYVMWFPARTQEGALDILGGHMDGITWRVTLGQTGQPLIYDAVHNCGCYHLFFPTPRVDFIAEQDQGWYAEPPMSPQSVAQLGTNQRLSIRIAQHTHFIDRVSVGVSQPVDFTQFYRFDDYESLESLAQGERFQSLFAPNALVPGTERTERFALWTMGIPSPGAMRQWGHHAVAFLGKRHFDDARLFESIISIK